ncbi:hypothetical protein I553_10378 [Mycobacterium xenopi 4042]|uniref:Lipopolysaccharide assembly protein A domain-containing protein n=1 Tax=Mycobacterium xenopi 4042 TaxID=1299334 RepID=X7ZKW1_MYCXE|nr:hypothetical protein I553_10378 [Mycobacterium xenopi 4042]
MLPDTAPRGLGLPQAATSHVATANTAVAPRARRRSVVISADISRRNYATLRAVGGRVSGAFGFILCGNGQRWHHEQRSTRTTRTAPSKDAAIRPGTRGALGPESVRFTRAAAVWTALTVGMLILIVLLIFIAQNTTSAQFAFLGWRWTLPLGVAILLAAVCGGLITVLAGTARIYQLRRAARKDLARRR